jgi:galactose mutarotase-like enzyme
VLSIKGSNLQATVSDLGAELVCLQDGEGRDLLWNGDPAFWTGHAPLLFPIVGNASKDQVKVAGRAYPISRHGFARTSQFERTSESPSHGTWRLASSDATRVHYPYDFVLDVTHRIDDDTLSIRAEVTNAGAASMPASFGFHPAFRWPLPYGQPRASHDIVFDKPEPSPIRRLDKAGLLGPASHPTPVQGNRLALDDSLFTDDALIFDRIASRRARYGAGTAPRIEVDFPDMPYLGVWSKPGAGFVCIEPWHGFADPVGFDGELAQKPGMVSVAPGASAVFAIGIRLTTG